MKGWVKPGPQWWTSLAFVLSLGIVMITTVLYVAHKQEESDSRWCTLLHTLYTTYEEQPPETEVGRRLSEDIDYLHTEFHCEGRDYGD